MTHDKDYERPESGAIIDTIQRSLQLFSSSATMLDKIVSSILDCGTKGLTTNGRKKAKATLASQLLLCRRLLRAGVGDEGSSIEKTTHLRRAVAFLNIHLEALGVQDDAELPCPGWKGSVVEELIHILRQHGATDAFPDGNEDKAKGPYDLGQHTYQYLQASSNLERKRALLGVIESRFALEKRESYPEMESALLMQTEWVGLLSW
jgi:hypothetical protein